MRCEFAGTLPAVSHGRAIAPEFLWQLRPFAQDTGRLASDSDAAAPVGASCALQEGERKIVTIVFADIASSTALIGDRDAEDARRILKPTVDAMVDIVHAYEGITQELGDGIMASFGAPVALEDHAVRACYAALDMQEASRIQAAEIRREFGMLFEVRIGINSGPVVVTVKHQGQDFIDFRADGMPTHIAKRVRSRSPPQARSWSPTTRWRWPRDSWVKSVGSVPLRGVAGQTELYELEGVNTRMRMHALAASGLSSFVGRELEIESLSRAATRAAEGHGQVVALAGEAGVGKSRIFLEFTRSLGAQGWLILEGASVSYGKSTSYLPLVDLVRRYFEIGARYRTAHSRTRRQKSAGSA